MKTKQKLYFLKGLPACGKSTIAKNMVEDSGGTLKRVNKDEIRLMIDYGKWSREREKYILKVHNDLMEKHLSEGFSVISDNTNFAEKHYQFAKTLADKYDAEFIVVNITTPINECIRRDASRGDASVGETVIYRMWDQFVRPKTNPSNQEKPKACIFDIDGTLAQRGKRSPFNWAKVKEDTPHTPVVELYKAMQSRGYKMIIFTGRDGVCGSDTEEWLNDNGITYDHFDIRPEGNSEKDWIVKGRMFDAIKDDYNVVFCVDDRQQVVDFYRDLGLTVMQVDYGLF